MLPCPHGPGPRYDGNGRLLLQSKSTCDFINAQFLPMSGRYHRLGEKSDRDARPVQLRLRIV